MLETLAIIGTVVGLILVALLLAFIAHWVWVGLLGWAYDVWDTFRPKGGGE